MITDVKLDELTNEEIIPLIKETNDEELKNYFFNKTYGLSVHIANNFTNTRMDLDDLISIAHIGLIKAFNTFDIKRGKFTTYAGLLMTNEILMELRKNKKWDKNISIEEPLFRNSEGQEFRIEDTMAVEEPEFGSDEKMDLYMALEKVLKDSKERDKKVFHMYYIEEMGQREIAKELNITQSYTSRILGAINKKMKLLVEGESIKGLKTGSLTQNVKPKAIDIPKLVYIFREYPHLGPKDIIEILPIKTIFTVYKHKQNFDNGKYDNIESDSSEKSKIDSYIRKKHALENN